MKKTRNLPENFRITNHNRIEGGYKSTKFWFSGTCLVVQKRFRVLQRCEQKQNQYRQMWNQSHEMIKPVSNLSIPCVDSRVQIPRDPAWKKEKMNQILNKMEWRILEKPCERNSGASSQRNNNPWISLICSILASRFTRHNVYNVYNHIFVLFWANLGTGYTSVTTNIK
jgi:hypothetical protein